MSDARGLLREYLSGSALSWSTHAPDNFSEDYMADDPNLITQHRDTEDSANGVLRQDVQAGHNNAQEGTHATPETMMDTVFDGGKEDVEMTTLGGEHGEAATGFGKFLRRGGAFQLESGRDFSLTSATL